MIEIIYKLKLQNTHTGPSWKNETTQFARFFKFHPQIRLDCLICLKSLDCKCFIDCTEKKSWYLPSRLQRFEDGLPKSSLHNIWQTFRLFFNQWYSLKSKSLTHEVYHTFLIWISPLQLQGWKKIKIKISTTEYWDKNLSKPCSCYC